MRCSAVVFSGRPHGITIPRGLHCRRFCGAHLPGPGALTSVPGRTGPSLDQGQSAPVEQRGPETQLETECARVLLHSAVKAPERQPQPNFTGDERRRQMECIRLRPRCGLLGRNPPPPTTRPTAIWRRLSTSRTPFTELVDWWEKDDVQRQMRSKIKRHLRASGMAPDSVERLASDIVDLAKVRADR